MSTLIFILIGSGALAGAVNFFVGYLNLPFPKPATFAADDANDWPTPKSLALAITGYLTVGIAGAFLTMVINAMIPLKGLEAATPTVAANPNYNLILFGYGLIFGYSTARILLTLLDSIMKRLGTVENKVSGHQFLLKKMTATGLSIDNKSQQVIDACEKNFDANKANCSGFVIAVAQVFGITLTGLADQIVDEIQTGDWTILESGAEARAKADDGWFVVAGLKGSAIVPPQEHGHVVVVVSGPIKDNKYPSAYWGKLNGVGEKDKTINWAWDPKSRDKVIYSARMI